MKNLLTSAIVSATVLFPTIANAECTTFQKARMLKVDQEIVSAATELRLSPFFNEELATEMLPHLEKTVGLRAVMDTVCSMHELSYEHVEYYVVEYEISQNRTLKNIQSLLQQ